MTSLFPHIILLLSGSSLGGVSFRAIDEINTVKSITGKDRTSLRLRRKPPKGNVRRVTSIDRNLRGTFTNKAGNIVQFESFGERGLTLRFERDHSVKDYRSQPLTFTFPSADEERRERKYTPDFIVWRLNNAIEIHEVTLSERRKRTQSHDRERAARRICQTQGWKYIVHTEHSLLQEPELTNLLALYPYRLMKYAHEDAADAIREHLFHASSVSISECLRRTSHLLGLPESRVFGILCHLLWEEKISADLRSHLLIVDCEFNPAVKIWLPEKEGKGQ